MGSTTRCPNSFRTELSEIRQLVLTVGGRRMDGRAPSKENETMIITSRLSLALLALIVAASLCSFYAQGQTPTSKSPKEGSNVTVTGCLQKGDEPDEYSITGTDGKTYGLRSNSVKLADHLGHKVTVTGKLQAEEKEEKHESKEAGDLSVTSLKMISSSCQ
jgi:hypothetical protein